MSSTLSLKLAGDWAPGDCKVSDLEVSSTLLLNLEGPVLPMRGGGHVRLPKAGPSLFNLELPRLLGHCICSLANNHFMDYGVYGLNQTLELLEKRGFSYVGAASSAREALAPIYITFGDMKVAIVSRCEAQFGVSSDSCPGVARFDTSIFGQISELKEECDLVVASIHAAAEMLPWPSPDRQLTWRALIDAGADIVHGHHAHVPQGWEEYRDGYIFYGLGNFCVDPEKWSWHPNGLWSLCPHFKLVKGRLNLTIETAKIESKGGGVVVAEPMSDEYERHLEYLSMCNQPLSDAIFLKGIWQEASVILYRKTFRHWLGFERSMASELKAKLRGAAVEMLRGLCGRKNVSEEGRLRNRRLLLYHLFACDSHRDVIQTALGVLSGEIEDLRTHKTAEMISKYVLEK